MAIRPSERLELARAAYRRAIALAGARGTAASWRRALAAAKNLARATRDCERPAGDRSPPAPARVRFLPLAARELREERRFDGGALDAVTSPRCWRLERWPALAAEWRRSRALMAQSRRLVDEAHALRRAIERLTNEWSSAAWNGSR